MLDGLLAEDLEIPDRDVELRAYCSLALATVSCCPRHPRLGPSIERVSRLLAQGLEPDQLVTAGDVLLRFFAWAHDVPNARWVIGLVEPVLEDKSVPPLAQLYWWSRVGMFYTTDGRYAAAEAALRKADEIGVNFGSHTATVLRHLFWVFLRLVQRDAEEAKRARRCHAPGDESRARFGPDAQYVGAVVVGRPYRHIGTRQRGCSQRIWKRTRA